MGKKKGKGPGSAPPRSHPVSESESGNPSPATPVAATSVTTAPPATIVANTPTTTNATISPSVPFAATASPAISAATAISTVPVLAAPLPAVATSAPTAIINAVPAPVSTIAATPPHSAIAAPALTAATIVSAASSTAVITTTAASSAAIVSPKTTSPPIPSTQISTKLTDIIDEPTPPAVLPLTTPVSKTEGEKLTQKAVTPPKSGPTVSKPESGTEKVGDANHKSSPLPTKGDSSPKPMPLIQNLDMPASNIEKSIKKSESPPKVAEAPSQKVEKSLSQKGALQEEQKMKPVPATQQIMATAAPVESLQQKSLLEQKIEATPQKVPQKSDKHPEKTILPSAKVELPQQVKESLTQMVETGLQKTPVEPKQEEQTQKMSIASPQQVQILPKSSISPPQDVQARVEAVKAPISQANIGSQALVAEGNSPTKDVPPVKLADIGITKQLEQAVNDPSEKAKSNQKPEVPKKPPGLMQVKGSKPLHQQQQVKLDTAQEKAIPNVGAKESTENVTLKQEFAAAVKSQDVSKSEESTVIKNMQSDQETKAIQSPSLPLSPKVENIDKSIEKVTPKTDDKRKILETVQQPKTLKESNKNIVTPDPIPASPNTLPDKQSQGLMDFMKQTTQESKTEISKDRKENTGTADIKLKPEAIPQKQMKTVENKIEAAKDTKPVAASKDKSGPETGGKLLTESKKQTANESSAQNTPKPQEQQNQKDSATLGPKLQKQTETSQKQKSKDDKNKETVKPASKTESAKVDKPQKKLEEATKDSLERIETQKQTDTLKDSSKSKDELKKSTECKDSTKPDEKANLEINQVTKNEQGAKPNKNEPKKGSDNDKSGTSTNKKQSSEETKEVTKEKNNASDKKTDLKSKVEGEKEKTNKQKQNAGAQKENKSKDEKPKIEKAVSEKENEEKVKPQKQTQSLPKDATKMKDSGEKSLSDVGKSQKQTSEKEAKGKSQSDGKNEPKAQPEKGKGQANKKADTKPQSEKGKEEKSQKAATATKEGKVKEDKATKKAENAAPQKSVEKDSNSALLNKEKAASDTKTEPKPQTQSAGIPTNEVNSETPVDGAAVETSAAKKKRRRKKKKPAESGTQDPNAANSDSKTPSEPKPAQPKPTQGTKTAEKPKTENPKVALPGDNTANKPPGEVSLGGIGENTETTQTKKKKNKKKKKQSSSGCETVTGTSNSGNETAVLLKHKYAVHRLAHHLSNCCCVCKSTGNDKSPVLTCSACSLACYCGREHQVQHWPEHKEFCNYISTVLSKERPYFFSPAEKMNQDERRHFKLSELQLCQKALNRTLTPLESALILHPRACFTCYKPVFQNVCTKCHCINYCCSEHLPSDHKNWCDILRIKLLFVQSQKEHGSSGVNVPRPLKVVYPLNSNMKEYLQTLDFIYPNNMPKELYYAHISELATYPLSLLHALQLLATQGATNPLQYEHLVVHIVGAEDVYECCQMLKWKYFFVNLLPKLKTLHLVFIGCELSIEDEKVHVEGRLVYEFHAKMTYLDYCKKCYIKPSIVCAFNSGLYRNTGYNGSDSWGPSIVPMLNMNPGAPLLLTAYTHMESQLDVQRLKEIFLNSMQIVQQPLKNPYASIFPNHNLVSEHECPVAFRNYYLTIVRHA